MKVLGYNGGIDGYPSRFGSSHDAAAALVVDGELVAACEEERFSREKHTARFPRNAIEYCLREGGLRSASELDLVAYYFSYEEMFRPEKLTQNRTGLNPLARAGLWAALTAMRTYNTLAGYSLERSKRVFERAMGAPLSAGQFTVVPHHVCHIASTYYHSPFDRALCLSLDAEGESASTMAVWARGTELELLRETFSPNSFGYLYTFISTFIGFGAYDEYKVMGLAPYGDPSVFRSYFRSIIEHLPNGEYRIDPNLMMYLIVRDSAFRRTAGFFPPKMVRALGPARRRNEPISQRDMDVAAALQEALEDAVLHVLAHWRKVTGEKQLCMAGGVALNCTMNGKIVRSGLFDRVWVQPAAHDAGTCVGAALFGYHNVLRRPREVQVTASPYLGPAFDEGSIDGALREFAPRIRASRPAQLYRHVAAAIAGGSVVGWYQGRTEWGPRALGNRSIVADPRRADMKDIINSAVKMREGFRPFAPACLHEHAAAWFDMTALPSSPYMLFTVPVHLAQRSRIPAVTHVDGSARVQTVSSTDNPRFYSLITEFYKLTGVPIVLNTSFNTNEEPIVNSPDDAIRCFLNTNIDLLVLGDVVVEKQRASAAAQPPAEMFATGP